MTRRVRQPPRQKSQPASAACTRPAAALPHQAPPGPQPSGQASAQASGRPTPRPASAQAIGTRVSPAPWKAPLSTTEAAIAGRVIAVTRRKSAA